MTVWYDVSDLVDWPLQHLTGIQRTVVGILSELRHVRPDVRLFRYDPASRTIAEVGLEQLPEVVRVCLLPVANDRAGPGPARRPVPLGLVAPAAAAAPKRRLNWWQRTVVAATPDDIRTAWRHVRLSVRGLVRTLRTRRWRGAAASAPQEPTLARAGPPVVADLFRRDDVVLSGTAGWGLDGYGETIAASKRVHGFRCVSIVYDLIPTLFPQWTPNHAMAALITRWVRRQIRNADLLLTISEFQRREITRYIRRENLPARPVEVIRLGDDPLRPKVATPAATPAATSTAASSPLPRVVPKRPFVLCVSTLEIRKNHVCLYHVWRRLAEARGDECPELLLIGTRYVLMDDLLHQMRHDTTVNTRITMLTSVPDEELAWYYANCLFTIYPSLYEGWGLPVSESLRLGKYCIASGASSIPEAGGDLVDYFDPVDVAECHRLVVRALDDRGYVAAREAAIRAGYVPWSWRRTAEQVDRAIRSLDEGQPLVRSA
ncbi:glycosyltransferase family 1 protein [Rhodoplanes sp. TEM]|uniref:Glycosyltransferase family 1 protein n=1 Tax=Rhodoplanes tepidamans TaxID=200616 RepID=A0ABT5J520_RHOTP|nr:MULTISPECIES: glycosyltransferase family 1 protein [Rhodoplanes]MDC7784414.1 glycosyltransferase family 1 protein [Rhodoplanes tepidamans]MDC7984099.1 glycosyltransferase family 1 protein [Rhodoplanes sp. TEM]MDQ0356921.1 glycosyltransferase involved in cell wall biosynthesis [Rhodoplanes tepidamans]